MFLTLNPALNATHRRTVNGHQYVFEPRTPLEVNDDDLLGMAKVIGHVLVVPKAGTFKVDHQATDALKAMLQEVAKPKAKKSK